MIHAKSNVPIGSLGHLPTTEELLSSARKGDKLAFEELVRRYQAKVRSFCSAMLNDPQSGDDVAQDVFLRAYQGIHNLREDAAFSAWLMTLARNRCVDVIRSERRETAIPFETVGELSHSEEFNAKLSVYSSPAQHESLDLLKKLLRHLPDNQREILLLRELQGFSYDELGEMLSLTLDGVKGQLKRARAGCERALRHLLQEGDVGNDARQNASDLADERDSKRKLSRINSNELKPHK